MTDKGSALGGRAEATRFGTCLYFALLGLVAFVVYLPSLRVKFFVDDWGYLNQVLTGNWWRNPIIWDLSSQVLRPVTVIAIGTQWRLFGNNPFAFHLVALAMLLTSGVLTYLLTKRFGIREFGARAAAAIVVLHSTSGYVLAWTASTSSLISVNLALTVLILLAETEPSAKRRVTAAVVLVLALLSREIVIMLPAIVTAMRWMLLREPAAPMLRLRKVLRQTSELWALLLLFIALRVGFAIYAQSRPQTERLIPILNISSFADSLPMVPSHTKSIFFLAMSPFRFHLGVDGLTFPVPVMVAGALCWIAVVAGAVMCWRGKLRVPAAGLVWYALAVVPPIFLQAEITYVNYSDLAIPGLAISLGALVEIVSSRWPSRSPARIGLAAAGLVLLTWLAYNGGNTLIRPAPPMVTRGAELADRALKENPHLAKGATITVYDSIPEDTLWTSNGDLFRVTFNDPNLRVNLSPDPAPNGN